MLSCPDLLEIQSLSERSKRFLSEEDDFRDPYLSRNTYVHAPDSGRWGQFDPSKYQTTTPPAQGTKAPPWEEVEAAPQPVDPLRTSFSHFSADRYYARQAQKAGEMPFAHDMGRGGDGIGDDDDWGGPSGTTPADKLHFTNLVLENDDDIMVEARALLEDWTSNPHPPRAMDDASSPIKIASGLSDYQSLEEKMEAAQERESLKALLGLPHTDTFMSSSSKSKHPSVFPPPPPSSSSSLSRIGNINKTQDRHLLAQTRREMSHRSKSQHLERQLEQKQQRMIISLQARREQVQISGAGGTRHEPSRKLDVAIRAARLALAQDAVTVMASPRTSGVGSHRIGQSKSTKQMQDQVINDAYRQLTQNPTSNVLPASHLIWKNNVPVKIDHKVLDPPFNKQALSEDEGDGEQDLSEHDGERDERRTLQMIKVEEMANVKRLKNLKKPFSGWRALIIKTEGVVERFQVISTWRDQSRVFAKWLSRTRRAISHRETLALAAEHQRQQEALVRAIRYARGMALSKAFMGWTRWVRGEKEARRVKEMHEERKRRMEEALKRREEAAAAAEMERFERESVKAAAVQINAQGPAPCQVTQPMPASETSTVTSPLAPPAPNKPDSPPTTNEVTDITHPAPIPAGATTTSHELHEPTSKCGPSQSKPRRPIRTQRDMELIHQMEQRDAGRRNRRLALEQKKQERLEAIEAKKCAAVQAQLEAEEAAKNLLLAQKRAAAEALAAKQAHQKRVKQIVEGQCGRRHLRLVLKVFRTWIDSVRVMEVQADEWRLRKMWLGWKHVFDMRRSDREEQADRIWRNKSLATSLRDWKAAHGHHLHQVQIADHRNLTCLVQHNFRNWRAIARQTFSARISQELEQEAKADRLARKLVPKRILRDWRSFVKESKENKWREFRKQVLRERVKEMLHHSAFETRLGLETIEGQDMPAD